MVARRRTGRRGPACVHIGPSVCEGRVVMDWHTHLVERRAGPCRVCGTAALLRDCTGVRCHKVCAEAEATRDLTYSAARYATAGQGAA